MHRRWLSVVFLCLLMGMTLFPHASTYAQTTQSTGRQNTYPIVLVHGFGGWGRDEVLGFKYWGGFRDIESDLRGAGYEVYTAAVGPFSSNWDRAVELYTQLRGGTVDYGAAHAARHGHARFGRTYPGLYPQWGQVNPATGLTNKIHLMAHSQGGQTVRVLAQLLENGDAAEIAATPASELSPLFDGQRKSWVSSITTISSPHDGTTLVMGVNTFLPYAQQMIALIAAMVGSGSADLYDFKLDQWGLTRQPGESFSHYADRVWASALWEDTFDISAWDLSPDGARELNSWVHAQPDVYYFSWATEKTYRSWLTGHHLPDLTINPIWTANALYMGAYTRRGSDTQVGIDSSWWQNDGVVNTNSMDGPTLGSSDQIVRYNGTPQVGTWNYMGVKESFDHSDIIGITIYYDVRGWFRNQAALLASLPQ